MADTPVKVGVRGLGARGLGGATQAAGAGLEVAGYDPRPEAGATLVEAGGRAATSPADAARGAELLLVIPVDAAQAEAALFGPDGAVAALPADAVVMLSSTVPVAYTEGLAA